MPVIQSITLSNFLPSPKEQLHKAFPPNHNSLSAMLGLCLVYLKELHPAKLAQPNESSWASAHIINLFQNNLLVQSLLPKGNPANTTPAKKLNGLQIHLTSLENMLANLAKATTKARKEFKTQPQTPSQPAKPTATTAKSPTTPPTYAAMAALPQHPSIVVEAAAYTWPDNQKPLPLDICVTINAALDCSNSTQVHMSAARWTAKGNLVFWGGANMTAQQLTTALPHFSKALQAFLSASAKIVPQTPPTLCHNIKWSKLCLNAIPMGKTETQEAQSPNQVHHALATENPSYATLTITQKPSWVWDSTYTSGTTSFLSVSFEDPNGTSAQNLLCHCTLYAFGHVIMVKRWKQSPPKCKTTTNPAPPTTSTRPKGTIS